MKRSKRRANKESSEFLLVYEQKYGAQKNETKASEPSRKNNVKKDKFKEEQFEQKIRAHVKIDLNTFDNFIKFQVSTNEVPISQDKSGKDIVVDWFLMDGFDSDDKFWVDANGLQMVQKTLDERKEYKVNGTKTKSSNFYPITSAIAVRDFNKSTSSESFQKQVTVMTERS